MYRDKYQLSDKICQLKVQFHHSKYGKIIVDLNNYSNPQTRYGLGLSIKKHVDLSGLLVREYKVKSMKMNEIHDKRDKNGKIGKNKVYSDFVIVKRPIK